MPVSPTYPGVYIQEIPSGVRTITGVSTSVAAFVDFFPKGPLETPVQVFNWTEFVRTFGGLHPSSEASYGIQQFFLNGGTEAWAVRTASGDLTASDVVIGGAVAAAAPAAPATGPLVVTAKNPGVWGNNLRVRVDWVADRFNLVVSLYGGSGGPGAPVVAQEVFRGLSLTPGSVDFAEDVVNDSRTGSTLVTITVTGTTRPLLGGTLSGVHSASPTQPATIGLAADATVSVTIAGESGVAPLALPAGPHPIDAVATALQAAVQRARPELPAFAATTVEVVDELNAAGAVTGRRLRLRAGPTAPATRLLVADFAGDPTATDRLLLATGTAKPAAATRGGELTEPVAVPATGNELRLRLGTTSHTIIVPDGGHELDELAGELQNLVRAAGAGSPPEQGFAGALVTAVNGRLVFVPGGDGPEPFTIEAAPSTTSPNPNQAVWTALKLTSAETQVLPALRSEPLSGDVTIDKGARIAVTFTPSDAGATPVTRALPVDLAPGPHTPTEIARVLTEGLAHVAGPAPAFTGGVARVADGGAGGGGPRLLLIAGVPGASVRAGNAGASGAATTLKLTTSGSSPLASANVQEYQLGAAPATQGFIADTAQVGSRAGGDGDPPDGNALMAGIGALDTVDVFNLLCLPRTATLTGDHPLSPTEAGAVVSFAQTYCGNRRAFFLMDTPDTVTRFDTAKVDLPKTPPHTNTALFYPRVRVPDPLSGFRLRSVGASGTLAGLFARTDADRGVWKAPAGTDATLRNVPELTEVLTDPQNGQLNRQGVNCLRTFPVYGTVSWGSRTRAGADQLASEWKYIPVRRLALYIEESLFRGTQWAVFQPNDAPLWSELRSSIGTFMNNLYRKGAFQGSTPGEAYLVRCDAETTTQADIDLGIVNISVGFAPLKPAEFVIISISQLAGQSAG
ncbi:phage tail sheath C-terminal domain-containing protein [Frankia sp. CiP1_Cm_nod2]|uniref:phage tail sheath C-terminal domain-containing protein n=1 Tax=Frankia sp. CiP1_Cm_nod2 TaxID=2897161 RepID=UPI0020246215